MSMALALELVICISIHHIMVSASGECYATSIDRHQLNGHLLDSFPVEHMHFCFERCKSRDKCYSINFHKDSLVCELNNSTKDVSPRDFNQNLNTVYFENIYRPYVQDIRAGSLCFNGGTCKDGSPVSCACPPSFKGQRCELIDLSSIQLTAKYCQSYKTDSSSLQVSAFLTSSSSVFCRVFPKLDSGGIGQQYRVTLAMRTWRADSSNMMFPSMMFNVQDEDNFDMLYFRMAYSDTCVQPAYTLGGDFKRDEGKANCLLGPPPINMWFTVTLSVTQSSVTLMVNGAFAKSFKPYFPLKRQIGFGAAIGYFTIVQFKDVRLE
ncbi:uncharacterized protein LOC116613077 [Nematostella vectensis]|uniref:uncharacterized protein LOC116613077 n=1 Tax=Nematostella vectensis TaxID=45351 RepID=UPI00138FE2F8|nr:uncharacterized protein LOC116613077 [Nematostella vectensis]